VERKERVAGYPFNTMIERKIDNYSQARGFMGKMEASLVKMGGWRSLIASFRTT
jgi:hypothetical protein